MSKSASSCERSWQVEALRDGRLALDPEARAAFERHVQGCARCQSERQALETLGSALRALPDEVHELDEVAMRRQRQRLLAQANREVLKKSSYAAAWRTRRAWGGSLALAVAAALAIVLIARQGREAAAPASAVTVEPEQGARWQRKLEAGIERVDLTAGTLLFRVARSAQDPPLRVHVPDGEIEDLGTTFRVSVRDGTTRAIDVQEGRVLFHRSGARSLYLGAGSHWSASSESRPAPSVAPQTPTVAPVVAPQTPPVTETAARPRSARHHGAASHADAIQVAEDDSLAQTRAREDAAYLQVVALLREGRSDEARLAALAYLRAYPDGFRRVEVARVAGLQTSSPDAGQ